MALIVWDSSYSVNNREIDQQHQRWIEIYNTMHEALVGKNSQTLASVTADIVQAMHDYANYHFQFEEQYLDNINYPERVHHRRLHKDFDTLIYSYKRGIQTGEILLNSEIAKTLENWLVDHILVEDNKYSVFAAQQKK